MTLEADKTVDVTIYSEVSAEMEEMWSFYHDKSHQLWLWWAVERTTNTPLAYTFGTREHKYLDELPELLKPFHIGTVYADNNFAYRDRISAEHLITGKKGTRKIERNHLTLRTRIKRLCRKTICFSKDKRFIWLLLGLSLTCFSSEENSMRQPYYDTTSILELPKSAWASIGQKIETATMQKADLEIDLSKLRIVNKIRYTEKEIIAWLKLFCKGDLFDMEFRRRIIDTFINSIYLYDDRVIIFYNIRGGKQISYIDMIDATEGFPGLDDQPDSPSDSAEPTESQKKPDTVNGVRLLNGLVRQKGLEPPTFWFVVKIV